MLWATSPACTELEQHVLDWLAEMLGLPARFRSDGTGGGVIQDSASSAVLVALTAALHKVTGGAWRTEGVAGSAGPARPPPLPALYPSQHAHSSLVKGPLRARLR